MYFLSSMYRGASVALLLAVGTSSWSAEPLTLMEAQRIAVERSQQLVAQDALARAAGEQAVAAGQLPDPVLKLGIDNLPVTGTDRLSLTGDFMTMRRIGVMQEIPRAEKRQLKAERFEKDAQRARAQRELMMTTVRRDTALAWLDRYYAQSTRALVQQQLEESSLQVHAADVAFATGKGTQADVFAARAALIGLQDRLNQVDRQSRSAGLMLARWVGAAAAERLPVGTPPWQSAPLLDAVSSERLKQYPDLRVMRAEIEALETDAQLAQANKKSDWSVEASYAQRGPAYSNMLSIGVSIPLQWDARNRQDRELAAKLALVDEAKARYEDALRSREAEIRNLLDDWQTGMTRLARYRDELIPVAGQRTEAALTSYRVGKSDLATALAARRDGIDVRMQALSLELETARAWAQLHFLVPDERSTSATSRNTP
ncbi:MAG: transporter [Polaromonas sp. 35-63-240]|jgi:outer membrane protein TolC|nr:MAG: transporter [Polaromonas sp. 35-63-240]